MAATAKFVIADSGPGLNRCYRYPHVPVGIFFRATHGLPMQVLGRDRLVQRSEGA